MEREIEEEFPEIPRPGGLLPWFTVAGLLLAAGLYLMWPAAAERPPEGAPVRLAVSRPTGAPAAPPGSGSRTVRFAFVDSADSTFALSVAALARRVAELTEGRLQIESLPGGRVEQKKYGELELAQQIQKGMVQMGLSTTSPLTNFNPRMAVLDLPFLFQSYGHADRVLDGPAGRELLEGLKPHGLVGLGFLEVGFRIFSSTEPLPDLESFRGKRVRVMQSATYINFVKALGAEPVPSPVDRIYEMGRQGLIDAADRSYPTYWDFKLYEVHRYVTETRHAYATKAVLVNREFYRSLSPRDREALRRAVRQIEVSHRQRQREQEKRVKALCQQQAPPIRIFELTGRERARFIERCRSVYREFNRLHGPELLQRFRER